jgi:hypothetical protein
MRNYDKLIKILKRPHLGMNILSIDSKFSRGRDVELIGREINYNSQSFRKDLEEINRKCENTKDNSQRYYSKRYMMFEV